ncbi:MAG: hypothetical protein AAFZ87_09245, partial [Planctomycetota bacterium]
MAPRRASLAAALAGTALLVTAEATPSSPSAGVDPSASPATLPQRGRAARIRPRSTPRGGTNARPNDRQTDGPLTRPTGNDRRTALGADESTLDNPFGVPPERERRRWFQIADADGTGWLSYREARGALSFDGPRFRVFDQDHDGRFSFEEYTEFLQRELAGGRQPSVPLRPDLERRQPPRNAEQLRMAYDFDLDGHIGRVEMERILLDYRDNRRNVTASTMIEQYDLSGDALLGLAELGRLANYLMPLSVETRASYNAPPNARTPEELFGVTVDRGDGAPPRIDGPVPLFRRLDLDSDGAIEVSDLQGLEPRAFSASSLGSILRSL